MSKKLIGKTKTKQRQIGPEVLRFIFISLIMCAHFVYSRPVMQQNVVKFASGRFGIIGFLLLSGFYNVNSKKNRTKSFLIKFLLWIFWGLIIYIPCYYTGFQVDNPLSIFFGKFIGGKYSSGGFIYIYLGLTLFQQLLNKFIKKIDKWISFGILIVGFLILIPLSLKNSSSSWQFFYFSFEKLFLFVLFYTVGAGFAYYFKNKINKLNDKKFIGLNIAAAIGLVLLGYRFQMVTGLQNRGFEIPATEFLQNLIFTCVGITGIFLFDNFRSTRHIKFNKTLLFLGKITLAMYLMHPITGTLLDRIGFATPSSGVSTYYGGTFFAYYFIAIVVASLMYLFIAAQERGIGILINKHKAKKNINVKK